jgi:hypothetical protein
MLAEPLGPARIPAKDAGVLASDIIATPPSHPEVHPIHEVNGSQAAGAYLPWDDPVIPLSYSGQPTDFLDLSSPTLLPR